MEQQAIQSLGTLDSPEAAAFIAFLLANAANPSAQREVPTPSAQADLVEIAEQWQGKDAAIRAALANYYSEIPKGSPKFYARVALRGGDAERGKAIFTGHRQAQCVRCHKVGTSGGEAAPDLSHVASRDLTQLGLTKDKPESSEHLRTYLLESLLTPSAKIAPGYGTVTFLLTDGTTVGGIIKSDKDGLVSIVTPDKHQEIGYQP